MSERFDYNAIPDWAIRNPRDRTYANAPVTLGVWYRLDEGDRPRVYAHSSIIMPNGYYVIVLFEDHADGAPHSTSTRPWKLLPL